MSFQTEFEFNLPKGYMDEAGTLYREGTMRLATAADEILPLKDPEVRANPAYLTIIILARVVTRLGNMPEINPRVIEGFYAEDLAYLQEFYNRINNKGNNKIKTVCPHCKHSFKVENKPGE
jgi:hypothetical protein